MAHPKMFDDDDPFLLRVREIALDFPDAAEKVSHGRPTFFTTKVFTYYGGSMRVDGDWVQHGRAVLVLPDPTERESLLADPRVWVPAYLGPSGWIGLDLGSSTDWSEVAELIDASYRLTAGIRRVQRLDAD